MAASFLHLLEDSFNRHAARPALQHGSRTYTYSDLTARAREGAGWLQSLGVRPGDRLVLCTASKPAFLFGHLAALFAGAITVPLNPRFTRDELRFFLLDSGAKIAIVGAEPGALIQPLCGDLPHLDALVPDTAVLDAPKSTFRAVPIRPGDPCLIIYSSGTTGWPKGVVHTHGNIAAGLVALQKCWRFSAVDAVLNVLPLFHVHGLAFASLLTLISGGLLILDEFEVDRTLQRIGECSVFMAVPTIYYRFLEHPQFAALAKTWARPRLFTCGSAPIRAEVLPQLEAILGKAIINRYGMSEALVITSLPLDGPWPAGSVGQPLDGIELRVLREGAEPVGQAVRQEPRAPETRSSEPADKNVEIGLVQIRGRNLFREYWNQPDATRAAFTDGWFDTGDLGRLDAAGFLTLVGRKNDLIITNGYNVYPQVVERLLNACPGVHESAVVGIPDPVRGERVVAVIVRADPDLDEARLEAFWSERLIDYQRPRQVVFVEQLPRNALGKVMRRHLCEVIASKQA